MADVRQTFKNLFQRVVPWWLNAGVLHDFLVVWGEQLDALDAMLNRAIRYRFPNAGTYADALPTHSEERRLRQGPDETDTAFAYRLRTYKDQHKTRGGPYAMVTQVAAWYEPSVPDLVVQLVDRSGNMFTWEAGEVTRTTIDMSAWDDEPERWFRWFLFVYTSDSGLVPSENDAVAVPRDWNAMHIAEGAVAVIAADQLVWDQPGLVWPDSTPSNADDLFWPATAAQVFEVS
jgi:hypothetical protein